MSSSILVVEDNSINSKLAQLVLEHEGHVVWLAEDAESALAIIKATPPNLILLDIQLPRMDGLTLAKLIKGNEQMKHIKVIAFTAHAMKHDIENALAAGCDGCITKPIDTRKFPGQVAAFLK